MDYIFLFISILGLILASLILFFNSGYRSANLYLAGFFFFISLYLLDTYFILFSKSIFWVTIFITLIPTFFFLIGPFSFFYVRSIVRDSTSLNLLDYLHFGFFFIVLLGSLPYTFSSWVKREEVAKLLISNHWEIKHLRLNVLVPNFINQGFKPLHWLIYGFINWSLLYNKYKKSNIQNKNSLQFKLIKKWLIVFNINFTLLGFVLLFIMTYYLVIDDKAIFLSHTYFFLLTFSIVYILLNFSLLLFPQILYGLPIEQDSTNPGTISQNNAQNNDLQFLELINDEKTESNEDQSQTYSKLFSVEYITRIDNYLIKCEQEELYNSPEFNLNSLVVGSNIPLHHLSFYFNNYKKLKFTDWRNKLRIEYACRAIQSGNFQSITLEALANQCGFTAQSTFIRAFKFFVGITPSEYIKQYDSSK